MGCREVPRSEVSDRHNSLNSLFRANDRNSEPLRRRANRLALLQRRCNPYAKIYCKWCHHALPHHLASRVNHKTSTMGILIQIQSGMDTL